MPASPIELFTPRVADNQLNPNFRSLAARPDCRDCLSRWADGFEDVDNKIVTEPQTTFRSFLRIVLVRNVQEFRARCNPA